MYTLPAVVQAALANYKRPILYCGGHISMDVSLDFEDYLKKITPATMMNPEQVAGER